MGFLVLPIEHDLAPTFGASPDGIWNTIERPELERRNIRINYNPKTPCG